MHVTLFDFLPLKLLINLLIEGRLAHQTEIELIRILRQRFGGPLHEPPKVEKIRRFHFAQRIFLIRKRAGNSEEDDEEKFHSAVAPPAPKLKTASFSNGRTFSGFACLGILLSVLLSASSSNADDAESPILSLPLEQLPKVQVVTASKTKEDIQDSPGITQVITQEDIQRTGETTLAGVLDHATSIFVLGTVGFPMGPVSMRGDVAESNFMPRVLMLLDGRPFRDSATGGDDEPLLYAMPLSRVARIEIVRGPGSVLYGTNAYIGLINVITVDAKDQKLVANAQYGSYDTRTGTLAAATQIGNLKISGGGFYQESAGWNFNLIDERGVQEAIPLSYLSGGGDFKLEYRGFIWHNYVGYLSQMDVGEFPVWQNPIPFEGNTTRWISDLSYTRDFTDTWKGSFFLTYNMLRLEGAIPESGVPQDSIDENSDDFQIETTHFIKVLDSLDLTVGGTINVQTGHQQVNAVTSAGTPYNILNGPNPDPLEAIPFYRRALYQIYAQGEYRLIDELKFVAGGQLNKDPNLNVNLVPRIGAILSLESGWCSKILYGQGYREATGAENYTNQPGVLFGNPDLQPETISTFEFQASYHQPTYNAALTYFNSSQKNVISRTFPPGPGIAEQTVNEGTIASQGIELEGRGNPTRILSLMGGITYEWLENTELTSGGTESTFDNLTGMPLTQVKLGAILSPIEKLRFSLFDDYFGNFGNIDAAHPNADPAVRNLHDVSFNLEYQVLKQWKLNLMGSNLFNEPIYYPEVLRHVINSIPGRPGITFYGGITGTF